MAESFYEQYRGYASDYTYHLAKEVLNGHCLLHWIMVLNPQSILEVGAGSGKTSVILNRLLPGAKITAVDIDPDICKNIRKFALTSGADIEVSCRDGRAMPFRDNEFDLSFSVGVVEHLDKAGMQRFIREQLRVARTVIVEVPLVHWFLKGLSAQGNEIVWPKSVWIAELSRIGYLFEFSFLGPPGEEEILVALLTNQGRAVLPLSPNNIVHFRFSEDGSAVVSMEEE